MNKSGHVRQTLKPGAKALVSLLAIFVLLLAILLAGCSGGTSAGSDQKAMMETVGKFYAAQGALDLAAMKAALYDPTNVSGIATATVPPGAQKTEVNWKNVGDTVVITAPSRELTLTVTALKTPANAVKIADPSGQGETLIMKKDGKVWKIDFVETQKASAASAPAQAPAPAPAPTAP
jgi:hypothetical protein